MHEAIVFYFVPLIINDFFKQLNSRDDLPCPSPSRPSPSTPPPAAGSQSAFRPVDYAAPGVTLSSQKVRRTGRSSPLEREFQDDLHSAGFGKPRPDRHPARRFFKRKLQASLCSQEYGNGAARAAPSLVVGTRGVGGQRPRGCLGTGTAHRGAPRRFSSTGCRSRSPAAGEQN